MRRTILLLTLSLGLWLGACSKKDSGSAPTQSTTSAAHNLPLQAKMASEYTLADLRSFDRDVQRAIFSDMDLPNRARIWRERISDEISHETNSTKVAQLNTLLGLASDANYLEAFNQSEDDRNAPQLWAEQNMMLFGYEEVKRIVTTLDPAGLPPGAGGDMPQIGCSCNKKDDWCISSTDNQAKCIGDCSQSDRGCGTLWLRRCTGNCSS